MYFTVETVATVGFGDLSFSSQPTWVEAFGIGLIVAGTTLVTTRRAWFVGAALGLEVLFTFYVGNNPFLLARLRVSAGGGLDGMAMRELPGRIRVAAIRRGAGPRGLEHPPRRDTTLAADEDAYLVGPYAELLEVLRHDREGEQAPVAGAP